MSQPSDLQNKYVHFLQLSILYVGFFFEGLKRGWARHETVPNEPLNADEKDYERSHSILNKETWKHSGLQL